MSRPGRPGPNTVEFGAPEVMPGTCSFLNYWSMAVYGTPSGWYMPLVYVNSTAPSFSFRPQSLDNSYAGYWWDVDEDVHNGDDVSRPTEVLSREPLFRFCDPGFRWSAL